ncbi:unnamed protein product [Adineta ricciae]|uniref:Myeloid leukemia factor n=1 Tax=Adineta ricciae TaxID=249248 RepID=A0A814FJD9_ADIRI|nr:unnamed protein product [Adineta ricciae]
MNTCAAFDNDPFFSDVTQLPEFSLTPRAKNDNRNQKPGQSPPNNSNQNLDLFGDTFAFMESLMNTVGQNMNQIQAAMANKNLAKPQGQHVSFSTSAVTRTKKENGGKPRVIQAACDQFRGPDGLERTRKAVRDTGRGIEKAEISHRLGQRGHKITKERDPKSGKLLENREVEHVDDENQFEREWLSRAEQTGLKTIRENGFNSHADKFLTRPPVIESPPPQCPQTIRASTESAPTPKKTSSPRKPSQLKEPKKK